MSLINVEAVGSDHDGSDHDGSDHDGSDHDGSDHDCSDQKVAVITINDPARRNAISFELADEMVSVIAELERDSAVGALVITGAPPAFCAGADLSRLEGAVREGLRRLYEAFLAVARSSLPTVAAVNGPAVGAGVNLALACDLRLAGRSGRFESRFLDLGLHPGGGHTWMLGQLVGPQTAAAMTLFGEALDGEAAAQRGLVWRCVEDDALLDESIKLARRAAAAPPELVRQLISTLNDMAAVDNHQQAVDRELEPQVWSVQQPAFAERLAALRKRISTSRQKD